jgi:4-oxalocrotonate tautomerase
MPLVRIDLRKGRSPQDRRAIADSVHEALVEAIGIPAQDRFQVIAEHDDDALIYDPSYLGVARTDEVVFIQIAISVGRPVEKRLAIFERIAARLAQSPGLRPEDVFVNLIETQRENWSFGNGIAQYAQK